VPLLAITPLTEALLPAVVELDRQTLGGLWSLDGYRRELDSPVSDLLVLVAASRVPDDLPDALGFGCLWAIADEAHIVTLMVHPDYQRQGLGQLLLTQLLQRARWRGLERATLEVRASNQPAISLYKKFGFQLIGQRRNYYQATEHDAGEDALIFWRKGLQEQGFESTLVTWQFELGDRLRQQGWSLHSFHPSQTHPPQSPDTIAAPDIRTQATPAEGLP
jgi:ribosomal-protein-alanine N-acetyltransferase